MQHILKQHQDENPKKTPKNLKHSGSMCSDVDLSKLASL